MNIEQIKSDLDNGIMISRVTLVKLVEAALIMKQELIRIDVGMSRHPSIDAFSILKKVEAM